MSSLGPQYIKDIHMVEQVQRMATRMIKRTEHMRFMGRLIIAKVEPGCSERAKQKGMSNKD